MEKGTCRGQTYQVVRRLGEGGSACVYLVLHRGTMQLFAMKEIPLNGRTWSGVEREYIRHLHHPGLPQIQDLFEEEGCAYLVMEYIAGKTLKDLKQEKGRIEERELLAYFIQLMEILEYLHSRVPVLIHGDIKPSNLMLDGNGRLILLDFGAALLGNQANTEPQGTYAYASPEQLACQEDIDGRSDLYSAGKTFQILGEGEVSRGFRRILDKCTKTDRKKRYPSAAAVTRAAVRCWKKGRRRTIFFSLLALVCIATGSIKAWEQNQEDLEKQYQYSIQSHQLSHLLSAVKSFPDREEAYHIILQLYLADEKFTQEESAAMEQLMLENGEQFQKNKEAYDSFCYELGIAYWFYYSASGGKNFAVFWFGEAADGELPAEKKLWAEFYESLGTYYKAKARQQQTGERLVFWNDFLKILRQVDAKEYTQELEPELRKKLQEEIFAQLYDRLAELKAENIGQDEVEAALWCIQELYPEGLKEEIQLAKDSLNILYGKEEE